MSSTPALLLARNRRTRVAAGVLIPGSCASESGKLDAVVVPLPECMVESIFGAAGQTE